MSEPVDDDWTSLRDAVARAIAEGRALGRATSDELLAAARALRTTSPNRLTEDGAELGDTPASQILDAEQTLLADLTGELEELAHRQLDDMKTFNIVLFGRTGTGKSSLLEAISHGDGGTISPGESDWTTAVKPVEWGSCRVVDTPGIEGWGRTMSRADLEDQARQELITADVVLLCFDTQNQKAGEFRKVADWIAEFRKPAIVVLNVRLPHWRYPPRARVRAKRVRQSQTVADHAAHIREGLTAVGLGDAPVVAVNTQRAVFGRAREPFHVPQEEAMLRQRADVGPKRLLEWSNLPVLEQLVATAVEGGAAELRRGMLLNQTVRTLERMAATQLPAIRQQAVDDAAQAEAGVERILELLGAPEVHLDELGADDPERAELEAFVDRLRKLEQLRGGAFAAPAVGSARRHGQNVIDFRLGPVRAAARERAENLVDRSMASRSLVDPDAFQREVFDTDEIERVAVDAVRELTRFLEQRIGLAAEDVVADLKAVQPRTSTVASFAGFGDQAAFVGVSLLTAGVLLCWSPAGWALLAGGVLASLAAAPLQSWLRRRSARKYEAELSRARGAARQAVNDTFDQVRDGIADWFMQAARAALVRHLGASVDQASVLRQVAETAQENREWIEGSAARVDGWVRRGDDPAAVLHAAMRTCERARRMAGRALWLGESWCDDPSDLDDDSGPPAHVGRHRRASVLARVAHARLDTVLAAASATPSPGSGQYWLAQVQALLADDPTTGPELAYLARLLDDPSPRVLVHGDYDTGKSSLVRRLLLDAGVAAPETLTVAGRPETSEVHEYPLGRFVLVDTPGLQSGIDGHDAAAHSRLPDAAVVLHVLAGNAVAGDRCGLDLVLCGDLDEGFPSKLDRTVFVVNRADELTVDPFDDDEGFAAALGRREREIRTALAATPKLRQAGVTVPAERIVFVASDPFGQVGDQSDATRADFDEYRAWDGVDALRAAFDEHGPGLQANGVDVSILHAGLGRFGLLAATAGDEAAEARNAIGQLDRLAGDVQDRLHDGKMLLEARRNALRRLAQGFVEQVVDEALTAERLARDSKLEKAASFADDAELAQRVGEWAGANGPQVEEWVRETEIVLRRRVESRAFREALGPTAEPEPVHFPRAQGGGQGPGQVGSSLGKFVARVGKARADRIVQGGVNQAARIVASGYVEGAIIGRQAPALGAYHQLKAFVRADSIKSAAAARGGHIGRVASRAGTALRIGGAVLEVAKAGYTVYADERAKRQFTAARGELLEQVVQWADDVQNADEALDQLRGQIAGLVELAAATADDRAQRRQTLDAATDRLARYAEAVRLARRALGYPDDEQEQTA